MPATVASWGGLQIQLVIPEVEQITSTISSVLELVNAALDIGLNILNIIRTFIPATINILRSLVNELIATIRNFAVDLRQIGIYANLGDLSLLSNYNNLKGGYAAYERRMLTRLNNRNDPTRPEFSTSSSVLALFIYASVDPTFLTNGQLDITKFQPMRQTLSAFSRLLGIRGATGRSAALPIASNLQVSYPFFASRNPPGDNSPAALAVSVSQMLGRDTAILSWGCASPPGASDQDVAPSLPPAGFLVEVSCYPSGFYVGYLAPAPSGTAGPNGTGSETGAQAYMTGVYQEGTTGQPLRIFGGDDTVLLDESNLWDSSLFVDGAVRPGSTPVFFFRDLNSPEVLHKPFSTEEQSNGTTKYYNQRTFFVPQQNILSQAISGGSYSLELRREDLPQYCPFVDGVLDTAHATVPTTIYARVIPVTADVTETNYKQLKWDVMSHRTDDQTRVQLVTGAPGNFLPDAKGIPSSVIEVTLPSQEQDLYGLAIQTAIAITLLSRSDLTNPNPITAGVQIPNTGYVATGLEGVAIEVFNRGNVHAAIDDPSNYFGERGFSPDAFVTDIYGKVVARANQYIATQGAVPPELLAAFRDAFQTLVNWQWSDTTIAGAQGNRALNQTILGSLLAGRSAPNTTVLARNVYSLPGTYQDLGSNTSTDILAQASSRFSGSGFGTLTNFDHAPVVYDGTSRNPSVWYARSLLPPQMYVLARSVLSLTSDQSVVRSRRGDWVVWRPFVGMSPLAVNSRLLNQLEGFLNTLVGGLGSVSNAILNVISFLQQRIREIQELIRRIEQYLNIPFQISIPEIVALPLLVNGTSGVVSGLVSAQNKPTDGPQAYAGGLAIMAGGLPALLTDLLLLVLSSPASSHTNPTTP